MHIYLRTLGSVLITSMKRLGCGFWRQPVTTTPMRMLLLKAAEEHERIANSEQRSAPKTLTRVEVEDPPAGLRERRARGRPFGSVSDTGKPLASAGKWEDLQMKRAALAVLLALGGLALAQPAHAVVCAAGVYRAGCVGPHGAAVVHRPYYHRPHTVTCAAGVYRAGCAGPNGAVVRRRY
jgi:hypothetical protein